MNTEYALLMAGLALITCCGLVGGWVFRLSARLGQADAKADAAAEKAVAAALTNAALRIDLEHTQNALVEHRVYVAKEYVSNTTIQGLEEKLIKAIDRLGDRLDTLFTARQPPPTMK